MSTHQNKSPSSRPDNFSPGRQVSHSPEKKSFLDGIIAREGHLIHKLKAKDTTGRWAYYFVHVTRARESAFLAAIDGDGTIDLNDFGQVVASNYGEEPSDEVRRLLKERRRSTQCLQFAVSSGVCFTTASLSIGLLNRRVCTIQG